eukprot:166398-Amphidinium_carterae.1
MHMRKQTHIYAANKTCCIHGDLPTVHIGAGKPSAGPWSRAHPVTTEVPPSYKGQATDSCFSGTDLQTGP